MAHQYESGLRLTKEEPLDPDLPICDQHHHLWDCSDSYPENRIELAARPMRHYLLEHLLRDIVGGHNIIQTVFGECGSKYKKDGPQELRPVGETKFVQGIAAQNWSGQIWEYSGGHWDKRICRSSRSTSYRTLKLSFGMLLNLLPKTSLLRSGPTYFTIQQ